MSPILLAIIIVTLIGLLCAAVLAVASHFMRVPVNEKEVKLRECLPGANCGACGFTGCDGYAKALAEVEGTKTNLCVPGADAVAKKVAEVLGVEAEDVIEQVAFVKCAGDCENRSQRHDYRGISTCSAAQMLYGGSSACTFGCLGMGDCAKVCPQNAICIENGIAHVDPRRCVGCGLCAKTCPNHIIELVPDVTKVVVGCSNHEKGAVVRQKCSVGCIGCGLCVKQCEHGAITVVNNLAVIDHAKCVSCGKCAEKCPVHAIKVADFSGSHRFETDEE